MGKQFDHLSDAHMEFIAAQPMFFTGTAARDGKVNISPKGMDSLRVLDANTIAYINVTGSGNETAGHLLDHPRMTLMWCSFDRKPQILRTYGTARTLHPRDADWDALAAQLPALPGARQIYVQTIEMVQTSCGYAVPFMDQKGDRDTLLHWTADKGADGVAQYWEERNQTTLDGQPTGILP